jgi:hypothetical protein
MEKLSAYATAASAMVSMLALLAVVYQIHATNEAIRGSDNTNEVQYNFQVIEHLDSVLLQIAEDKRCYNYVWGPTAAQATDNSTPVQCGDGLIDTMAMAIQAAEVLPCFSMNGPSWASYVRYVMQASPTLKKRVLNNVTWWPELRPYAENPNFAGPKLRNC